MTRQVQREARRLGRRNIEDVVEELPEVEQNEVSEDAARRDELLEDAECCLADIEEVLKDCEPKLPTDEEIVEKGHPNWFDDKYNIDYSLDGKAYDDEYDKMYAQYQEDDVRFDEAYERIHGVAYEHTGCGCGV